MASSEGVQAPPPDMEVERKKQKVKVQLIESYNGVSSDGYDSDEKEYTLTKTFQVIYFTNDKFVRLLQLIKSSLIKGRIISADCDFSSMVENAEIECYIHPKSDKLNKLSWKDIKNWDAILDLSDSVIDFIETDSAVAIVSHNPISLKAIKNGDKSNRSNSKFSSRNDKPFTKNDNNNTNSATNKTTKAVTTETDEKERKVTDTGNDDDDVAVKLIPIASAAAAAVRYGNDEKNEEKEELIEGMIRKRCINVEERKLIIRQTKLKVESDLKYSALFYLPLIVRYWDNKGRFQEIRKDYPSNMTVSQFKDDMSKLSKVNHRFDTLSVLKWIHKEWDCGKQITIDNKQCLCKLIKNCVNNDRIDIETNKNSMIVCFNQDLKKKEPILYVVNDINFKKITLQHLIQSLEKEFEVLFFVFCVFFCFRFFVSCLSDDISF